jgi:hypothetical protein
MHDADIPSHGNYLDQGLYPRPVALSARLGVMGSANRERNSRALFLREGRQDEAPRERRVPTRPPQGGSGRAAEGSGHRRNRGYLVTNVHRTNPRCPGCRGVW